MQSVMTPQLIMMEQCLICLLAAGDFPLVYTTEGRRFVGEGLTEAARGSPQEIHLTAVCRLSRHNTRGEAEAGAH